MFKIDMRKHCGQLIKHKEHYWKDSARGCEPLRRECPGQEVDESYIDWRDSK